MARRYGGRDDPDPGDRPIASALRHRVCVVADRGMISAEAIAQLEARRLLYILGVRERTYKVVGELVLDDPAPFVPLALTKRGKEIDYEAKTVMLAGRRCIVCRNHQDAEKDAADRASILAALHRQSAAPAFAAISGRSAVSASPSTPTRSRRKRSSTASLCCAPIRISTRSRRCSATSGCGRWISTRHGDSQDTVAGAAALSAGLGGRRRQGGGVARIAFNAAIVSESARTSTARFEPEPTLRQDRRPFWIQV